MISYIPFLKAKQSELNAMRELAAEVREAIAPFFDFPRRQESYNPKDYAKSARRIAKSLTKHWGTKAEFYFDDIDIAEDLSVEGEQRYAFVLKELRDLCVIPVIGIDRSTHNDAVARLKNDGVIRSNTVAFRAVEDDFEDFELVKSDIVEELSEILGKFDEIDLVLDCRLCPRKDEIIIARQVAAFAKRFCEAFSVRRIIVTGSSIPASSKDVLEVNSNCRLMRKELAIISRVRGLIGEHVITGDYATVSPFYSDAELAPEIMQNVMTARFTYSFEDSHYFIRGTSLKSGGYEQYFDLAQQLCGQRFFRGSNFSSGDTYFYDKSRRIGSNCTPGTVIKPAIVSHITYMVLRAKQRV